MIFLRHLSKHLIISVSKLRFALLPPPVFLECGLNILVSSQPSSGVSAHSPFLSAQIPFAAYPSCFICISVKTGSSSIGKLWGMKPQRKHPLGAYIVGHIVGTTTTTQLQRLSVAFALQLRPGPTCRDVICTQDVRKVKLTLSFIALFAVFWLDKLPISFEPTFIGKKDYFVVYSSSFCTQQCSRLDICSNWFHLSNVWF